MRAEGAGIQADRSDPVARRLAATLPQITRRGHFSGAILVARHGRPVLTAACGLASLAFEAPNTTGTLFNLASAGKMFTAVAVAQLAERGRLSFGARVGQLLPDYPNRQVRETVTVSQLLTHTGGLGDIFTAQFAALAKDRFTTIADFFPLFAHDPPIFTPGSRFSYSNAGFMVLGAIVERAARMSYFDYVYEHVFKPAGMKNTGFYELDREIPHRATSITTTTATPGSGTPATPAPGSVGPGQGRSGPPVPATKSGPAGRGTGNGPAGLGRSPSTHSAPPRNAIYQILYKGMPAGGSFSTVGDMSAFAQALLSYRLLSPGTTRLVMKGKVAAFPGERYGYGFEDARYNGTRVVGHGGGAEGAVTRLDMFPDKGYAAVTLANTDAGDALAVFGEIRRQVARA